MDVFPVKHVLRRCNTLLKRQQGSESTKQEYHYWISWLRQQFRAFSKLDDKTKAELLLLVKRNRQLYDDLGLDDCTQTK